MYVLGMVWSTLGTAALAICYSRFPFVLRGFEPPPTTTTTTTTTLQALRCGPPQPRRRGAPLEGASHPRRRQGPPRDAAGAAGRAGERGRRRGSGGGGQPAQGHGVRHRGAMREEGPRRAKG